ncbi:MAG: thioredoxin family protein [Gammaproteobacteria bacterium]|nr:thioredoxin family protein [Gammaproteobacteria bacterium]
MFRITLTVLAACLAVACESEPEAPEEAATAEVDELTLDPAAGIDWYQGSVDDAFAHAREAGKPIYLYWGADWCPPCHAIGATVFKSPEFLDRSQLFVPVYLDGDTEDAQRYGEEFGVRGYPTMIVFDPNGAEVTRIPSGIDLQAYANVLDLTLADTTPAKQLVDLVMSSDAALAMQDCTLLAYYSWGQDTQILTDHDAGDAFRRMHAACPANLTAERSILYLAWLDEAMQAASDEDNPVEMNTAQREEALRVVRDVLSDEELVKANIFDVLLSGADYASALTDAGSTERRQLLEEIYAALERIAADDKIYKRERIYTLAGKIELERIDNPEADLSSELQQEIKDMVIWADESTPNVYERQDIINALGNVLDDAGMDDVAKPMFLAELERSKQPYYFMVNLADIEQRAGNYDVAIDWLKQAYDATTGPATRFQWGYYYLTGLIEMAPADTQRIHDTTVALIDELQNTGGLYHRPKGQLNRIEKYLLDWGADGERQAALKQIRESVLAVCAIASHQGTPRDTCEAFLESA